MILGIDVGGTDTKMALGDGKGNLIDQSVFSNNYDSYRTPIIQTVAEHVDEYLKHTEYDVSGIGVSATGQIDPKNGVVIGTNGSIPGYEGTRFKDVLESRTRLPTKVLNDANAAALGESLIGAGKGCRNAVMVTIGTGVGGGIIADGKVFGGGKGLAGEIGQCFFGGSRISRRERFEEKASTSALIELAAVKFGCDKKKLNGRIIFDMAKKENQQIIDALNIWMNNVAIGLINLIYIFNPESIIIGGGVSEQKELFIKPLSEIVFSSVLPSFREGLRIESACLGNTAGIHGAIINFLSV